MSSFANNSRRTLIRFGKVCPFIICFVVLISDIENIIAILTNNTIVYDNILIYNTPISFAIGNKVEYDVFTVFVVGLISFSIEACKYNIMAVFFLALMLIRKHYLFTHDACDDSVYLVIITLCASVSFYFVYKGVSILIKK